MKRGRNGIAKLKQEDATDGDVDTWSKEVRNKSESEWGELLAELVITTRGIHPEELFHYTVCILQALLPKYSSRPSLTLNVPRSTISLGNPFLCTGVSPLSGKMIHPSSSLKCKYRHVHSAFCWTWRKVRFIQSSYFTVRQRILLFRWGWRFIYFSLMASLI